MMKGGMGNLMKQAQMMQENMKKAQAELANIDVEGIASNGLVKITMSCSNKIKRVNIDQSLMSDDKEMLEDLIVLALNDAFAKSEATSQQRMSAFVPAGMKLPF